MDAGTDYAFSMYKSLEFLVLIEITYKQQEKNMELFKELNCKYILFKMM